MRWTYRQVGPRHDRIGLTDAELRALFALEQSLPSSDRDGPVSVRRRLRAQLHRLGLAIAPLVRLAPLLAPVGMAVMVAFVATSVVIAFGGAVMTLCGMAALGGRLAGRLRARAARRAPG
jgi:hypothetical protein